MAERPTRPPDKSYPIDIPSDQTMQRLEIIATTQSPSADDIRLLALVLSRVASNVTAILKVLPGAADGNIISLDPEIQGE